MRQSFQHESGEEQFGSFRAEQQHRNSGTCKQSGQNRDAAFGSRQPWKHQHGDNPGHGGNRSPEARMVCRESTGLQDFVQPVAESVVVEKNSDAQQQHPLHCRNPDQPRENLKLGWTLHMGLLLLQFTVRRMRTDHQPEQAEGQHHHAVNQQHLPPLSLQPRHHHGIGQGEGGDASEGGSGDIKPHRQSTLWAIEPEPDELGCPNGNQRSSQPKHAHGKQQCEVSGGHAPQQARESNQTRREQQGTTQANPIHQGSAG